MSSIRVLGTVGAAAGVTGSVLAAFGLSLRSEWLPDGSATLGAAIAAAVLACLVGAMGISLRRPLLAGFAWTLPLVPFGGNLRLPENGAGTVALALAAALLVVALEAHAVAAASPRRASNHARRTATLQLQALGVAAPALALVAAGVLVSAHALVRLLGGRVASSIEATSLPAPGVWILAVAVLAWGLLWVPLPRSRSMVAPVADLERNPSQEVNPHEAAT